ncbi:YdcH family protein [Roseovarius albus]|uniref:YdcH family protein n=1 Tax=Roseovarius albus TaxID=1247867 RepID=UPI000A2723FB|nr:YdcH family protein [Roseovarius albus]
MKNRKVSARSLFNRITTLRNRHILINSRIDKENLRPVPDSNLLKQLKQERLGLKDAIRTTKVTLSRIGMRPPHAV